MLRLISQAEYAGMPEDKIECFIYIAETALRNYDAHQINLTDYEESADELESLQIQLMESVASIGGRCGFKYVEPILFEEDINGNSREIPTGKVFKGYIGKVHRALVSAYADQRTNSSLEVTDLPTSSRERIRNLISRLRTVVQNSDLSDERKSEIYKNIDKMESYVSNRKINVLHFLFAVSLVASVVQFAADTTTLAKDGPEILTKLAAHFGSDKKISEDMNKRIQGAEVPMISGPESNFEDLQSPSID